MSGLILKLRPNEELMINGVIVENGDKKTRLRVKTEGAHILRLKDAIRPEDATTPLKRAYYVAQMTVAGQIPAEEAHQMLQNAMAEFGGVDAGKREEIDQRMAEKDFYKVMRSLASLIALEGPAINPDQGEPTPATAAVAGR